MENKNTKNVVSSGMIGNALEWYDYAIYAQFADIISKSFFPQSDNPIVPMLLTLGAFAAGFVARPLGGVLFGVIGDRYGRKASLTLAILLMALPTALIGLLPTYASIGLLAPVFLTLIRIIQGLSLGGEFSSCIAYVVEYAPERKRGFIGSSTFVSMCGGMLIGSLVAKICHKVFTPEELVTWGWRLPFIAGIFIGLIGFYIRMHLAESPVYAAAKKNGGLSDEPVKELWFKYKGNLFVGMGIYLTVTVPFYTLTVFLSNFLQNNMGYAPHDAKIMNSLNLIALIISMPLSAILSDKIGRKPVLTFGAIAIILSTYPAFLMLHSPSMLVSGIGQIIFAIAVGIYMGPVPTTLVELYPTRVRLTGIALSYNISAALFGGTAPLVAYYLVSKSESATSVAFYIIMFGFFTLYTLKYFRETYKDPLINDYRTENTEDESEIDIDNSEFAEEPRAT